MHDLKGHQPLTDLSKVSGLFVARNPDTDASRMLLASCYGYLGRAFAPALLQSSNFFPINRNSLSNSRS